MEGIHRSAENPASFSNESTRSSSVASSFTVENSNEVLCGSVIGRQDECAKWTNEKHNSFLNFLEASFVKQMHKSVALNSRHPEQSKVKRNLSQKLPAKVNRVSKQGFAEGSDQNFTDEDHKEKRSSRKMNTSIRDISGRNQIVPSGKFENSAASGSSLGRYEQASRQHLLENYESFIGLCTNVKYFLKGS